MLPEGEDLLQQLSGEMGLHEFLEDVPMLDDPISNSACIYDSLMDDISYGTSESLLNDHQAFNDVDLGHTSLVENFSMNFATFPPSPSNSDSSASSVLDSKDGILQSPTSPAFQTEVTPPVSPPESSAFSGPIVSVSDLSHVKLPIPKIQKPSKARYRCCNFISNPDIFFRACSPKSSYNFDFTAAGPIVSRWSAQVGHNQRNQWSDTYHIKYNILWTSCRQIRGLSAVFGSNAHNPDKGQTA